ncbi:Oxoglutarate/iron-dependent dioxygenase [Sesbania bispinosa]|nr:Oxoglutarate/iron-dependent dioxygenase [Sesbania bispinosa]
MDGGRGRGPGRCSPFNHPPTSPPPVVVVGDEQSVSANGSNSWHTTIKDRRKAWQQKSHYPEKHNSPHSDSAGIGMSLLSHHVSNKLNICECDGDVDNNSSQTRTEQEKHPDPPFDICPPKQGGSVILKPPLLVKNRERRNEMKRSSSGDKGGLVLRPGMVLLKAYIPITDQVMIVKRCRELGLGPGGFYQPGYGDGTKLHLKMMCLGKNWDPQTSQYGHQRPSDGAKPPHIPPEFHHLIRKAIADSLALIQQRSKTSNPHNILPSLSPDICIVNFYSQNGRLGLHQDKDESEESLRQGLPVVSFSIGDSADFLYGDERDVDKAQKVLLESGDVLIFGGKSRNVFHGVTAIHPMTAPKLLLEETNLRPGRLNLTFRQY